jgi:hypothetical protein
MRVPLAILAAGVLAAAPASAGASLVFPLPSQVYYEQSPSENGCYVAVFAEYPLIRHAVSYRIHVERTDFPEYSNTYIAPPFAADQWVTAYPPPKGFGRFFLHGGGGSGGIGHDWCAEALASLSGKAKITSSKVSLDKPFERRFRKVDKPPWRPAAKPNKHTVRLDMGVGDPRVILVRRQGVTDVTPKGERQPQHIHTNVYAEPGAIVRTGRNSVLKVGSLDSGQAVLVGPDVTIEITKTGFEILEQPKHPRVWRIRHKPGEDYKVRTSSWVIAARG